MPEKPIDLTIRFPSRKAMMTFCTWMCDGGGEQDFMEASEMEDGRKAITRLQYHKEDPAYPKDDKRRYGKFMAENLIICHEEEKETS